MSPSPSSMTTVERTAPDAAAEWPKGLLFKLAGIDLGRRLYSRTQLERWLPHRGDMLQIDAMVWHSEDYKRGVGLKHVRKDEFWVAGHFPEMPVFPGVLQVEAAAQLAVILYNSRLTDPLTAAFTRIENCSFRNMVVPGDELYLLCEEVKWSRRGFTCRVQGMANKKMTFEAEIQGLAV